MLFSRFSSGERKRIYLDFAAATPVRTEVLKVMEPLFTGVYGNASAIHIEGRRADTVLEEARLSLARTLHIRPDGVVFTGNGTEANNLAIYGTVRHLRAAGKKLEELAIISTKIEHPSITRVLEDLASQGIEIRYVDLDGDGRIVDQHFRALLDEKVVLVTFAYANSEIGVVQDVKQLTRIVKKYNTEHSTEILTHLDAAQAPLWLPCQLDTLGVDMMALDAGKCYGPKGIGVLAMRHGVALAGVLLGGGQEGGLRSGTENVPLIAGATKAFVMAQEGCASRSAAVAALRDALIDRIMTDIEGSVLNGSRERRIANNVNISIPGIDSEFAVVTLDEKGIAASTKSACSSTSGNGSTVVSVITTDEARARSTIRFSLGEETTQQDIETTATVLAEHVAKMRAFQQTLT